MLRSTCIKFWHNLIVCPFPDEESAGDDRIYEIWDNENDQDNEDGDDAEEGSKIVAQVC